MGHHSGITSVFTQHLITLDKLPGGGLSQLTSQAPMKRASILPDSSQRTELLHRSNGTGKDDMRLQHNPALTLLIQTYSCACNPSGFFLIGLTRF